MTLSSKTIGSSAVFESFRRNSHSYLLAGQLSLLALVFALLYTHTSTVSAYLTISLGIAVVAAVAILKSLGNLTLFVNGFILFIALRFVYFFATDFRAIPFGDSYWDLGVIKTFLSTDQLSVLNYPLYPPRLLTWYSSWPLLHALETSMIQATGLNADGFHMLFSMFISSVTFVFAFLFIREISKVLKMQSKFLYLSVVLFAISPEAIYWQLAPTRQEIGTLLLTMSFYLVAKGMSSRSRSYTLLSLLCAIALVLGHHFTSAIAAGVFAAVAIMFPPRQFKGIYLTLAAVLAISSLLWWSGYARIIFEAPSFSFLASDFLSFNLGNLRPATYPDELTPSWVLLLLAIRDAFLYATPVIGAFFLIKKRDNPHIRFVLILSAAAALMVIVNLSIQALEPTRVIMMFMPVLSLFSAYGYSEISRKRNLKMRPVEILLGTTISITVFSAMVGLWGHSFAPLHLYDNSINGVSIGEHSLYVTEAKDFLTNRINYTHVDRVVSEFYSSPILDLPASQYGKVRIMQDTVPVKDGRTVVLSTDDLYVYKYSAGYFAGVDPHDRELLKQKLANDLVPFDLTYSDGSNKVYR